MRYSVLAKDDNGYIFMNPYENTVTHHGDIDQKTIYVCWEPISGNRIISLKEITSIKWSNEELMNHMKSTDVLWATYRASVILFDALDIRLNICREFRINCMNYNNSELAMLVISKLWEKHIGTPPQLPINYGYTTIDQRVLDNIPKPIVTDIGRAIKTHGTVDYRGLELKYGHGGVHAAKKGVHECEPYEKIVSIDVNAFYASIIRSCNFTPHYVNVDSFHELITDLMKRKTSNRFYKFVLTYLYGNICNPKSWLYNPMIQNFVVYNGQLILTELLYKLCHGNVVPLLVNTDEVIIRIPKSRSDEINKTVDEWCGKYNLTTKSNEYARMVIRDVNNYIAIGEKNNITQDKFEELKSSHPEYYFETLGTKYYVATAKYKGVYRYLPKGLIENPKSELYAKVALWYLYGIDDEEIHDVVDAIRKPIDIKQLEMFK